MKKIITQTTTVNMETGEEVEEEGFFYLDDPPEGTCTTCGRAHEAEQPHDLQRLYYQYSFYADYGRWPTWADAIAHCAPDLQAQWKTQLQRMGKWSEPGP